MRREGGDKEGGGEEGGDEGLTAIVIFPIMSTGILPAVRSRSRLPPSCTRENTSTALLGVTQGHAHTQMHTYHILHAYRDLVVDAEATKKSNDVGRVAFM